MPSTTCLSVQNALVEKGYTSHKMNPIFFPNLNKVTYSSAPFIFSLYLKAVVQIVEIACRHEKQYALPSFLFVCIDRLRENCRTV